MRQQLGGAAARIQRCARGWIARRAARRRRADLEQGRRRAAAICIQSVARGWLVRSDISRAPARLESSRSLTDDFVSSEFILRPQSDFEAGPPTGVELPTQAGPRRSLAEIGAGMSRVASPGVPGGASAHQVAPPKPPSMLPSLGATRRSLSMSSQRAGVFFYDAAGSDPRRSAPPLPSLLDGRRASGAAQGWHAAPPPQPASLPKVLSRRGGGGRRATMDATFAAEASRHPGSMVLRLPGRSASDTASAAERTFRRSLSDMPGQLLPTNPSPARDSPTFLPSVIPTATVRVAGHVPSEKAPARLELPAGDASAPVRGRRGPRGGPLPQEAEQRQRPGELGPLRAGVFSFRSSPLPTESSKALGIVTGIGTGATTLPPLRVTRRTPKSLWNAAMRQLTAGGGAGR